MLKQHKRMHVTNMENRTKIRITYIYMIACFTVYKETQQTVHREREKSWMENMHHEKGQYDLLEHDGDRGLFFK